MTEQEEQLVAESYAEMIRGNPAGGLSMTQLQARNWRLCCLVAMIYGETVHPAEVMRIVSKQENPWPRRGHGQPLPNEQVVRGLYTDQAIKRIWVKDKRGQVWVYDHTRQAMSHDPMDRVGGPYHISAFVPDGDGDNWFLFCVADSYFPPTDLCRGNSMEDAYEEYLDWAAEHRHLAISEEDLKDYGDEYQTTSNGVPIDDQQVHCEEVSLFSVDFI